MCSIVGIFNRDSKPVSPVVLGRMTDVVAHRGPDGEGLWVDGHVGLGHRRLAIIDLSAAGHQPMMTKDGRYVLSYNGEIYNFQELRIELEAKGYQFRSRTDSEVLLYAYAEWGAACLDRLNGMFAFAVWDQTTKQLFLARDRYGIKPLYYAWCGDTLLFASEIKAFLEHPKYRVTMDPEGLLEYCTFQNFFTDRTLFSGVKMLPAGTHLSVNRDTKGEPVRYWDYCFEEPEQPEDDGAYIEELDRLMCQAIKRQLVSDVEVGSYLSGGLDSGTVTALASQDIPNLCTFTCGFDLHSASGIELGFDERDMAELMSYRFGTEHYEMVLKAGDMERAMPSLAYHIEEPRVGQSYPNYYVARLASKFVKVALCGTGGDELFGGYPWRYYRAVVNDDFEDYIDKYYSYWQRLIPSKVLERVLQPVWPEVDGLSTRDIFRDVFQGHHERLTRPEDFINHSLYLEARTFLHGLLTIEDKLSMAHGLETRVPFLDNDLVDFAMKLPAHLKLAQLDEVVRMDENEPGLKTKKYFQKTNDGKQILRSVMARHLPAEVVSAEKKGFSAPDSSWFKGESIDYVRRTILSSDARIFEYLDRDATQALVKDHLEGRENRRLLIWSLLNLEWWLKTFMA